MSYKVSHKDGDLILRNKYGIYSRNELRKQLIEGHFTLAELAEIYNLKPFQIRHILKSLGISIFRSSGFTRVNAPEITSSLHQTLLGTLAGDGYLRSSNSYGLAHSFSQAAYCYHVAQKIHPFVSSIGLKSPGTVAMWTHSHEAFFPYHKRFYSRGLKKKYFTGGTLRDLDWEGLAYWFMDDGKMSGYGYYLCVGKITDEEMNILLALLKDRFGLDVSAQYHHRSKGHRYIYVKAADRNRFRSCLSPYVIPSMRYKLDGSEKPVDQDIVDLHVHLQKIAGRPIRFFGDDILAQKIKRSCSDIRSRKDIYAEFIRWVISQARQISRTEFRKMPPDKELRAMFASGKTDRQIAHMYGVGRGRICAVRKTLGIKNYWDRLKEKNGNTIY